MLLLWFWRRSEIGFPFLRRLHWLLLVLLLLVLLLLVLLLLVLLLMLLLHPDIRIVTLTHHGAFSGRRLMFAFVAVIKLVVRTS